MTDSLLCYKQGADDGWETPLSDLRWIKSMSDDDGDLTHIHTHTHTNPLLPVTGSINI